MTMPQYFCLTALARQPQSGMKLHGALPSITNLSYSTSHCQNTNTCFGLKHHQTVGCRPETEIQCRAAGVSSPRHVSTMSTFHQPKFTSCLFKSQAPKWMVKKPCCSLVMQVPDWQNLVGTLTGGDRELLVAGRNKVQQRPRRLQVVVSSARWWSLPGENPWGQEGDHFGRYPWEERGQSSQQDSQVEWVREDVIHLITDGGVVKIGGSRVPRRLQSGREGGTSLGRVQKFREEDFMDPHQQLCLGSLFDIAATNGLDMGRRFCVLGFCRSVEMLSAVVEDAVREQGGEIVVLEKRSSGLHEKLHLTVAIPLLWGVPPAVDTLNHAIRSGGGIVDKVYSQWEFF